MTPVMDVSRQDTHFRTNHNKEPSSGEGINLLYELIFIVIHHKLKLLFLLIAVSAGITIQHKLWPMHRSESMFIIEGTQTSSLHALTAKLSGINNYTDNRVKIDSYLLYLESHDFYKKAAKELIDRGLNLDLIVPKHKSNVPIETLADEISKHVKFKRHISDSIKVIAFSPDKNQALLLANVTADIARLSLISNEAREIEEAKKYLSEQLSKNQNILSNLESELALVNKNNDAYFIPNTTNAKNSTSSEIEQFKQMLRETQIQRDQNEILLKDYTKQAQEQEKVFNSSSENHTFRSTLSSNIYEIHKTNKVLDSKISALKKTLAKAQDSYNASDSIAFSNLSRKILFQYTLIEKLQYQLFETEIQQISISNRILIREFARLENSTRDIGIMSKLSFGVLLATITMFAYLLMASILQPLVRDRSDLLGLGLHYLGSLPDNNTNQSNPIMDWWNRRKLKTWFQSKLESPLEMALHHIRARILQKKMHKHKDQAMIIALHSPCSSDGKTFTTKKIAENLRRLKVKVLLIDTDLRKRNLSSELNCLNKPGVAEFFNRKIDINSLITLLPDGSHLLPAGAPEESTYHEFTSERILELLDKTKSYFDFIIIDTPPVLAVSDALVVSTHAHINVLVTRYRKTKLRNIEQAINSLNQFSSNQIFSILNGVENYSDFIYVYPSLKTGPDEFTNSSSSIEKQRKAG